jgi:hypothetical protein
VADELDGRPLGPLGTESIDEPVVRFLGSSVPSVSAVLETSRSKAARFVVASGAMVPTTSWPVSVSKRRGTF